MTKPVPKDAAARARIVGELKQSLLVEAGAGSGKTHELAARMAAGVAAGTYEIERMAAVTFTRKAAAELRGRFQLALEQQLAQLHVGPSGPWRAEAERRLRRALSNLERFFAGTIHAFCARLLRERPVEAGVSPGFTELDEAEELIVRQQSWRDYRAQARAAGHTDYLALLDAGLEPRNFEHAFNNVCQYEDVEFPPGNAGAPDTTRAWEALASFWKDLKALLPASIAPETTCKTQQKAARFQRTWNFGARSRRDAQLVKLLEFWESQPGVTLNRWAEKADAKKAEKLHDAFRSAVVIPFLTSWRGHVYRRAITLLTNARAVAEAERRRRNTLSFNDLLLITAKTLRENAEARRSLQQKYRWLFVDEFQDTDPVQAEIMFLLAADEVVGDIRPADWRSVALRPGGLFVVGDPKQSIYRFRRADIDIYNDVRTRLGGQDDAGLVKLTTNFRSVPALCDWANQVFTAVFPAAPTQHSPQFAPLDAVRAAPAGGSALAVLTIPDTIDSRDVPAEEASRIARYIRAEVDAGRRSYGDFLVLTRKKKSLREYATALEGLQVPIEVSGAGAFGESAEVRELARLIGVLADPQDAVALVGVLRGSFFGVSDRDLFAFRQAGGYFGLFSEVTAASGAVVARALESLRRWYGWTRRLPAGAALDRILEDSGFLALAAASPGGVEAGDLLHAVDRVRAVLESGLTLADAADALATWSGLEEEATGESSEVDSLPLQPGRPDVVRLMNLHKAKGLEADVVFLADPLGGYPSRADVRVVRTAGSEALGYFQIVKKVGQYAVTVLAEPEAWDTHAAAEEQYLAAEGHRLLYVAATRAKDLLVVGRYAGNPGKNPAWAALGAHLAGVPELAVPAAVAPAARVKVDLSVGALKKVVAAAEVAHHVARQPSWSAVSVTSEVKGFPRITPGGDESSAPDDPTSVISSETPSRRADAGIAWGTLVHGLLEHAMRHKAATREDLRRLAMWLTVEEPQLRVVIDQALDTVQAVATADFWHAARASAECHEEAPFSVRGESDGVPQVVAGTIDLVYRASDGWQIVDYKTDAALSTKDLRQRYALQLKSYARSWGRVTPERVQADVEQAR